MNLTCAIVDDEPLAVKLLETYVGKTDFLQLCGTYSNAIAAESGLRENPVDLLFLDIQMPDLSGLDFARMVDKRTLIVFTTAFSNYAIDGYKVDALDYLLKPVSYADFLATAVKARERVEALRPQAMEEDVQRDYFFVKSDYKLLRINFSDILYVEGLKDYVKIYLHSTPRPVLSLTSMRAIEEYLPPAVFQRTHRSFIVNMERMDVMERGCIVFGEKRVPVSDSYKDRVNEYVNSRLLQSKGPVK